MSNLEYQYQCGGCVYYDFQGDYKKDIVVGIDHTIIQEIIVLIKNL